jgi:hypothetical protein
MTEADCPPAIEYGAAYEVIAVLAPPGSCRAPFPHRPNWSEVFPFERRANRAAPGTLGLRPVYGKRKKRAQPGELRPRGTKGR